MRLFIAIELPEPANLHLDKVREALRSDPHLCDAVRWVRRENAHLTLKFLGEVDASRMADLTAAISDLEVPALELYSSGMLWFPSRGPVQVIGVSAGDDSGMLERLQQGVEIACERVGVARERRRYIPHITLARRRPGPGFARLSSVRSQRQEHLFPGPRFQAEKIALMQSFLRSDGAQHEVVQRFP